jgi:hypothetical protein
MSYRRSDDPHFSGRVYDKLVSVYGHDAVFRDIDSIPAGQQFAEVIDERLRDVDVVVALIGPTWSKRLDTPEDFVHMELLHSLVHRRPIIPLLIDETPLPAPQTLPAALRPLLTHNAVRVRRDPDFHRDMEEVIEGIAAATPLPSATATQPRTAIKARKATTFATVCLAAVAFAVAVGTFVHLRSTASSARTASSVAITSSAATSSVAATTSPVAATSTATPTTTTTTSTVAPSGNQSVPLTAFHPGDGCTIIEPQTVSNTTALVPACGFASSDGPLGPPFNQNAIVNVALSTGARHLIADIAFADQTSPADVLGEVRVYLDDDHAPTVAGTISIGAPFTIDVDVTNRHRLTLQMSVPPQSRATLENATFVVLNPRLDRAG